MADQQQQTQPQQQNQQPTVTQQQPVQPTQQQGSQHVQPSVQQQQVQPIQQATQQPTQQQATQQSNPQQVQPQQQISQQQQQQPATATNTVNLNPQNAAAIFSATNSMMSVSNPMVANAMTANALTANAMAGNALTGSIAANAMTVNAANLRNAIPQVQVIPQMQSPSFMQYPFNQQQIMLQNAAMQAAAMQANAMNMNINPQQINMANMNMAMAMQQQQQRMGAGLMSPSPGTPTQTPGLTFSTIPAQVTGTITSTANTGKQMTASKGQVTPGTPTQQATTLIGGKPIMPTQGNMGQPLVLGQISVLPNQLTNNAGFVASKGQTINLNQAGQTQLISTQAPIRFSQPQLASSTSQIIQSQPIMTNQSLLQAMATQLQQGAAIPLGAQQLQLSATGQSPTILSGQPVYIRTNQMQGQQGLMASTGVQAIGTSVKNATQNIAIGNVTGMQITKQGTQAQPIYPIKAVTARVNPTTVNKSKTAAVSSAPKNPKGRPRTVNRIVGAVTASASTNTVASALSQAKTSSQSKPTTPTSQALTVPVQNQSKSDSEVDSVKKSTAGDNKLEKSVNTKSTKEKTSTSSPTKAVSAPEKMDTSDKKLESGKSETPTVVEKQKAIVKPHILTHVIEGFIIQEGPEPFPVQRSSLLTEFIPPKAGPTLERQEADSEMEGAGPSELPSPKKEVQEPEFFSKCEYCGTEQQAARFKRSKRFCTMACAKRYNVAHRIPEFRPRGKHFGLGRGMIRKRGGAIGIRKGWRGAGRGGRLAYNTGNRIPGESLGDVPMEQEDEEGEPHSTSNTSGNDSSSTPESPATPQESQEMETETEIPHTSPGKWSVSEVYEFIKGMPGCTPYAEEFKSQEIDGQALMLLKEDHLMTTMNMKLGPALKICAKINSLRGEAN